MSPMGNCVAKHVYNNQTGLLEKSTYYILDAQGQQLSMYEHGVDTAEVKYYLKERNIYGSSLLGTARDTVNMYNSQLLASYGIYGNRYYQLTDHRNNVYTVINDHITPLDEDTNDEVDGYQVGIVNVADFSPFNVQLDGRTIKNGQYRYSVQGQESHDEIHGEGNYINYKYRGYDPRLGRLDWSIDPIAAQYPWNSPYAFSENVVIHAIELEGLEKVIRHLYNPEEKKFVITDKYVNNDLKENLNLYVYQNPDGQTTRQVYKSWSSGKTYEVPHGRLDYYGLINAFGGGYQNAVETSKAQAKPDPWYKTGVLGDWEGPKSAPFKSIDFEISGNIQIGPIKLEYNFNIADGGGTEGGIVFSQSSSAAYDNNRDNWNKIEAGVFAGFNMYISEGDQDSPDVNVSVEGNYGALKGAYSMNTNGEKKVSIGAGFSRSTSSGKGITIESETTIKK